MDSQRIVSDLQIEKTLDSLNFTQSVDDGRLMLAELMLKAGAGFYNSHTEESFLLKFKLLKTDRTPNKKGRQFLCAMFYRHSNNRPQAYAFMGRYRS